MAHRQLVVNGHTEHASDAYRVDNNTDNVTMEDYADLICEEAIQSIGEGHICSVGVVCTAVNAIKKHGWRAFCVNGHNTENGYHGTNKSEAILLVISDSAMGFEKSKTAEARSRQHKKRSDQLVAMGYGSATVTFENGSTIMDHYKALQDFCVTMGKEPEDLDVTSCSLPTSRRFASLKKESTWDSSRMEKNYQSLIKLQSTSEDSSTSR